MPSINARESVGRLHRDLSTQGGCGGMVSAVMIGLLVAVWYILPY